MEEDLSSTDGATLAATNGAALAAPAEGAALATTVPAEGAAIATPVEGADRTSIDGNDLSLLLLLQMLFVFHMDTY